MIDQESYDHTLDTPPAAGPIAERRPLGSRHERRSKGLGMALVVVGGILLASQLFGLGFGGGSSITLVDQTLPGSRIELRVDASDVEVRRSDASTIHIEAIQRGGSKGDYTIDIAQVGDTVRVSEARRDLWAFFGRQQLRYRIALPRGAQADIHTASGDIDVQGLDGAVSLASSSGDVRASDLSAGLAVNTTSGDVRIDAVVGSLHVNSISGDVRLDHGQASGAEVQTTSGEVNLDGVSGDLRVTTVSGAISVQDARDSRLDLSTTSGDIDYTGTLAQGGASTIDSISGDISLQLPKQGNFSLNASTVSGELNNEFDLRDGQASSRSLTGATGDGLAKLTISSTSGAIELSHS